MRMRSPSARKRGVDANSAAPAAAVPYAENEVSDQLKITQMHREREEEQAK
jgi:hypothetical protein